MKIEGACHPVISVCPLNRDNTVVLKCKCGSFHANSPNGGRGPSQILYADRSQKLSASYVLITGFMWRQFDILSFDNRPTLRGRKKQTKHPVILRVSCLGKRFV